MVRAVPPGAMGVAVAVVARQQPGEELVEVGLGARSRLHQRDPGGRVGREDVHQTVAPVTTEVRNLPGDVGDVVGARFQHQFGRLHERNVPGPIT